MLTSYNWLRQAALVVATSISLVACQSSDVKLIDQQLDTAIINGTLANESDPITQGIVMVVVKDPATGYVNPCSGVLINNRWVLTAAHCVYKASAGDVQVIKGPSPVIIGAPKSMDQIMSVSCILLHPDIDRFRYDDSIFINIIKVSTDAALLELGNPFKVDHKTDDFMQKIYMGTLGALLSKTVTAYGFGDGGTSTWWLYYLRQAQMIVRSVNAATSDYILPKNASGERLAPGDSGGPTFLGDELIGIHWGGNDMEARDIASPFFRDWVLSTTNTELGHENANSAILIGTTNLKGNIVAKFSAPASTTEASFYVYLKQKGSYPTLRAKVERADAVITNRNGRVLKMYNVVADDYLLDLSTCDPYIMGAKTCGIGIGIAKTDGTRVLFTENRAHVR